MATERTFYIAWNPSKREGFISDDKSDVLKALGRKPVGMMEATLGEAFRDSYGEQKLPAIQTVKIKV
jgi:hypothetical protein